MKVWITKYALTVGIIIREGEVTRNMICVTENGLRIYYEKGIDCFMSESDAIEKVKVIKDRKLKSLTKQIDKLKNIKIQIIDKTNA